MVLREFAGEKSVSFEEFWDILSSQNDEDARLELDEGAIIEMAASSQLNTVITGRIIHFLNAFVIPNKLGVVTTPDAGYRLGERKYRQPDAGFIAQLKLADLNTVYFSTAPDLAVEVVSEGEDIFKKALQYLHAGTKLVWAVYPEERVVYVMTLDEDGGLRAQPYHEGDTLDGGAVLPGFTLPVRSIFSE